VDEGAIVKGELELAKMDRILDYIVRKEHKTNE